jgi:uncharacterized protein (DUF885 family)
VTRPGYRDLVGSYLDLRWQLDPVSATQAGVGIHDGRFGRFTSADVKQAVAALKAMAAAFEEVEAADLGEEVDQTAVLNDIRVQIARFEKEKPHERNPEFHLTHLLSGLFTLLVRRDQPAETRAAALAGRLADVPRFLADARATLTRPARVFTETALSVAEGGRRLLREAVPAFAETVSADARRAIEAVVVPAREALEAFATFLGAELLDRSDGDFAIGRDAFDFRLHFEHALRETAPELLRYGERLVAETQAELTRRVEALAPGRTWRELASQLRATTEPPDDTIVPAYAGQMERARRFVVERDLVTIPPGELEVVATPSFMRPLIPFAAYEPPGAFAEDRTGWFYVTVPEPGRRRDHCAHEIACTALHEGYPGHHLHFLVMQRSDSPVRRVVGSPLTVEGWALYCEELMAEQGFLMRAEERFFQSVHMLWRAVRIVLDIRLHTMGMSVADAVRYMVDTLGIGEQSAESEVRRYCGAPAYQLCYAVGRRELTRLRDAYQARAGAAFSLRAFHDELLGYGALPVSLIRWGMGLEDRRDGDGLQGD